MRDNTPESEALRSAVEEDPANATEVWNDDHAQRIGTNESS
jgi:hypothetical protein